MKRNRAQNTHVNNEKSGTLGIPDVLRIIRWEKLSVVLPVKVQPTLAKYIRQQGSASKFIRGAIIEKLRRET